MPIKDALLPLDLTVAFDEFVIAWDHPLAWRDKKLSWGGHLAGL
jgi:hypothetical protein